MDFQKIIKPSSIALVGVTEKNGFGRAAALSTVRSQNSERVYYVNPKREELFDRKCYPSLKSLPEIVDCVVIITNNVRTVEVLREAGELGIKAAVIYASGFSEDGTKEGKKLEDELAEIAKKYDMAILGPNCMGMYNAIDKVSMWAGNTYWDYKKSEEKNALHSTKKGIGLICQSGFVICQFTEMDSIAYAYSTGNGNIITLEDVFEQMTDNDNITVISLYLEGLKKPDKFVSCLRRAALNNKPVVILKAGKSQIGAHAATSHTGNMAGSHRAFQAICEKYGAILVDDVQEMKTMSEIFVTLQSKMPKSTCYAAMNFSGGENIICADIAEKYGIVFSKLQDKTKNKIKEHMPKFATIGNPMDMTTEMLYVQDKLANVFLAFEDDEDTGAILIGSSIEQTRIPRNDILLDALRQARENGLTLPVFVIPTLEGTRGAEYRKLFADIGVVLMPYVGTAYKILSILNKYLSFDYSQIDADYDLFTGVISEKSHVHSEYDSKIMLSAFKDMMPPYALVKSANEIEDITKKIPMPWAMKINSEKVAHKSDAGGVILNIGDAYIAKTSYDEIINNVKTHFPNVKLQDILVSSMASTGFELIMGVISDPQFGPMVLVGAGGIFVEILNDTILYPAPMNKEEALCQLKKLKIYPALLGARGQKKCDIDALINLIVEISRFAYDNMNLIKEIDLNPVFVYPEGKGISIIDTLAVTYEN